MCQVLQPHLSVGKINSLLIFFCLIGLGLSIYTYVVELQLEHDARYKPMCDISPHMSCSKAFTSEYGKGFGIFGKSSPLYKPNSLFGLMFYSMIATLAFSNSMFITKVSLVLIVLSNIISLWFAYVLYFILFDFCIVCVSTYIVNVFNFLLIQLKVKSLDIEQERSQQSRGVKRD
ncbi:unnamed protein product [Acanthoscelides obtectus]|uniref:vitamin-K-epoxide reductase (warfarin-sensitive) n=1 Tax=Acanthoscelides obtectus TaxID=200917 RepID=A0A9P0KGY7_ACAOB|nr:unnamed protein product [Acanthoscelides obtectus]CAK1636028.1 Vitamin K epoxide reductase complex subunit 1-like protein 1 [Acanthoscelides obtectus]